jgi:hypothetical protein
MTKYCLFDSRFQLTVALKVCLIYLQFGEESCCFQLPVWTTTAMGEAIIQVYSTGENGKFHDLVERVSKELKVPAENIAGYSETLQPQLLLEYAVAGGKNHSNLRFISFPFI